MIWFILLFAALCAVTYGMVFAVKPVGVLRSVTKTSAILALAGVAYAAEAPGVLVVALVLCAVGDWCLSRDGSAIFLAGFAAFAAAHLAYIVVFVQLPEGGASLPLVLKSAVLFFLVVIGIAMSVVLWGHAGAARWAVVAYIAIILGMDAVALTVPLAGPSWFIPPAALLFIASAMVLAFETFLMAKKPPAPVRTPYVIWSTYWVAQLLFTLAFVM